MSKLDTTWVVVYPSVRQKVFVRGPKAVHPYLYIHMIGTKPSEMEAERRIDEDTGIGIFSIDRKKSENHALDDRLG